MPGTSNGSEEACGTLQLVGTALRISCLRPYVSFTSGISSIVLLFIHTALHTYVPETATNSVAKTGR